MARTTVITGSASGIGAALRRRLEAEGERVVGVDLVDAEVIADLATPEGRAAMVADVAAATDGVVDAVVANAGVSLPDPLTVRVCYFGAVAPLEGLRPLLTRGSVPRAAATASIAVLGPLDDDLVAACLAGDEATACAHPAASSLLAYGSAKRALARWLRAAAPGPDWAGAGIPLNAVGPGVVTTPMTAELLATDEGRALVDGAVPMPLGGHAEAAHVAEVLAFLIGPGTARITGQVLFVDGGADAVLRGDDIW